jgi:transcriptional regulator with XRE-family HTH domain
MTAIANFRKSIGMTQAQLAKELNIRQSTVSMWEMGINMPRTDTLLKLAAIFGCTVDDLLNAKKVLDKGTEREEA